MPAKKISALSIDKAEKMLYNILRLGKPNHLAFSQKELTPERNRGLLPPETA